MANLFVYGSLQPGGPNEHVLRAIRGEWRSATVRGRLKRLGWGTKLGYPGLVLDETGDVISGHVLSAKGISRILDDLDRFEGEEYQRVVASVTLKSGKKIDAHVYVLRNPESTVFEPGGG